MFSRGAFAQGKSLLRRQIPRIRAAERRQAPPGTVRLHHNVIQGEFAKAGQTDWAVLCSMQGSSRILVFWNSEEQNPASLAAIEDRTYLQGITDTEIGYSRGIQAVGKKFILRHYRAYGGLKPPAIDHEGIDDAFIEKGSVTWYFDQGKWLKLTGAD